jgi:S-adenosylmethionine/arginine decarboxylase-like enzyme
MAFSIQPEHSNNDLNLQEVERKIQMAEPARKISVSPSPGQEFMMAAIRQQVWGIASSMDIYNCDPEKIRSAGEIRRFVVELCELIEMKRFGETQVIHFGEDERVAGYSMVQLIETSLISAHFANLTNTTYLDVFSCKPYDPEVVQGFSQDFFGGSHSNLNVTLRQ